MLTETNLTSFTRHKDPAYKLHNHNIYDSRMQNIDRINSKIKNILECINSCEIEQQSKVTDLDALKRSRQICESYLGKSVVSGVDGRVEEIELEETKIIEKQEIFYPNDRNMHIKFVESRKEDEKDSGWEIKASRSSSHFEKYLTSYKQQLEQHQEHASSRNLDTFKKDYPVRASSCFS